MTQVDLSFDTTYWVEVDLERPPRAWVPGVVRERWAEAGVPADADLLDAVVHAVVMVVESLHEEEPAPFMAFLLHPDPDDGPLAVVTLRTESLPGAQTLDEVAAQLRMPEELLELPAEERLLDSPAGPVRRIVQRFVTMDDPDDLDGATVTDAIAYAWVLEDDGRPVVVTVSTAFEDHDEARRWLPQLDELALSLTLTP
ncbi:MAG: hypothetical protein HY830_12320 [Actinobacteria bacterium]|nr:hypothetical protein [Actinomycetota bacterium]